MGGYSSFPVCVASYLLKIPVIIYENNIVLGRANKVLLPLSKKNTCFTGKYFWNKKKL